MSTITRTPNAASLQQPTQAPLALHDGPVIVAAGTDDDAPAVLRIGCAVAAGLHRNADIVSAIDPATMYGWETGYGAFPRSVAETMIDDRKQQLARIVDTAGASAHSFSVELGAPQRVIPELASAGDAALIVMGIGRHRPVDRLLGTETALRVVQHSRTPVLAVPQSFTAMPTVAVVGVDFSDAGWHAAACALPLLAPEATLHLVHVWQPSQADDEEHLVRDERHVRELPMRFHELTESLAIPPGVTVKHEVREGKVTECLLAVAESRHAGLLVVGRHGRGWLERLRVGSVATNVLRGAACAVLVVPEPLPHLREHVPVVHGRAGIKWERAAWGAQLDAFTRRNAGHPTVLELSDAKTGSFSQERGYVLFGITYRDETNDVEILLGEAHGRKRHLTSTLRGVSAVSTICEADGSDHAVRISHGSGQALLTMVGQ